MKKNDVLARVALMVPIDRVLDYRVPPEFQHTTHIGTRVMVPLGKRMVTGFIIGLVSNHDTSETTPSQDFALELKGIQEVLDEEPLFDSTDLRFFQWISQYYFSPLGEVIRTALPVSMNIRSMRALHILPEGRRAAASGLFLNSLEIDVLRKLSECNSLTVHQLQAMLGKTLHSRLLDGLVHRGFLEISLVLKKRGGRLQNIPSGSAQELHPSAPLPVLTHQQHHALETIIPALQGGGFSPFLRRLRCLSHLSLN